MNPPPTARQSGTLPQQQSDIWYARKCRTRLVHVRTPTRAACRHSHGQGAVSVDETREFKEA